MAPIGPSITATAHHSHAAYQLGLPRADLEGDRSSPAVTDDDRPVEPELADGVAGVGGQDVHAVPGRRRIREAVRSLVEGDQPAVGHAPRDALPVPGVRAETVQEEERRKLGRTGWRPFQPVEANAFPLEIAFVRRLANKFLGRQLRFAHRFCRRAASGPMASRVARLSA